jgi:spectinomycin phosphotransferase
MDFISPVLEKEYGVSVSHIEQLYAGADQFTETYAVYDGGKKYFLKIRRKHFIEGSITIPCRIFPQKGRGIIQPVKTKRGKLFLRYSGFSLVLYPFVRGESGWNRDLTETQWHAFGGFLHDLHHFKVPEDLLQNIPVENFSPVTRIKLKKNLAELRVLRPGDAVPERFRSFILEKSDTIMKMIERAGELAESRKAEKQNYCLCHGDNHAGNILLDEDEKLFILDWDTIILAPKERDLKFICVGIVNKWNTEREIKLFYAAYGKPEIDKALLSYYRHERILLDLEEYYEQIGAKGTGDNEKEEITETVMSQFKPGNVVEIALQTDTGTA